MLFRLYSFINFFLNKSLPCFWAYLYSTYFYLAYEQPIHFLLTYLTLRVKEGPAALFKEALRVINDGLHDLGPVQ